MKPGRLAPALLLTALLWGALVGLGVLIAALFFGWV